MAFEHWYCEGCREDGCVRYQKHASVFEVATKIGENHRKKSPICAGIHGRDKVRIGRQHVPKVRIRRVA